jgi:hypothetical protein
MNPIPLLTTAKNELIHYDTKSFVETYILLIYLNIIILINY